MLCYAMLLRDYENRLWNRWIVSSTSNLSHLLQSADTGPGWGAAGLCMSQWRSSAQVTLPPAAWWDIHRNKLIVHTLPITILRLIAEFLAENHHQHKMPIMSFVSPVSSEHFYCIEVNSALVQGGAQQEGATKGQQTKDDLSHTNMSNIRAVCQHFG